MDPNNIFYLPLARKKSLETTDSEEVRTILFSRTRSAKFKSKIGRNRKLFVSQYHFVQ